MRDTFHRNLRFLLWRAGEVREEWAKALGGWLHDSAERAGRLLSGQPPTDAEIQRIARRTGLSDEELLYADLLDSSGEPVLTRNIDYLVGTLGHGRIGPFAADIGVDRATVSSWRAGRQRPNARHQAYIKNFFGLPSDIDLEREPIFLRPDPVGVASMRRWLHLQVDQLDRDEVQELFPALRRLLAHP